MKKAQIRRPHSTRSRAPAVLTHLSSLSGLLWPKFLSIERAAAYASASTDTIEKWILDGLPVLQERPGMKRRLDTADLDKFLEQFKRRVNGPRTEPLVGPSESADACAKPS